MVLDGVSAFLAAAVLTAGQYPEALPSDLISRKDAERLASHPSELAKILIPDAKVIFFKAQVDQVGGPAWRPAAFFWTKAKLLRPMAGSTALCQAHEAIIQLDGRALEPLTNVYAPVFTEVSADKDAYCAANTNLKSFFQSDDPVQTVRALDAVRKVLEMGAKERQQRVKKSCNEYSRSDNSAFCGLTWDATSSISGARRTSCRYIMSAKRHWLRTKDCYEINFGQIYVAGTVAIEIGPSVPRVSITKYNYVI